MHRVSDLTEGSTLTPEERPRGKSGEHPLGTLKLLKLGEITAPLVLNEGGARAL